MENDQYGEQVPDDLVLLPDIEDLTETGIKIVCNAGWYDCIDKNNGIYLTASAKIINYLSESTIEDAGGSEIVEIMRVNDILKRWDAEYGDGFYHA